MRMPLTHRTAIFMLFGALITSRAPEVHAGPTFANFSCSQGIAAITWDSGGLFIDCIGQPHRFAAFSFVPCSGMPGNIDNIKIFETIAMSALLSGKTLTINNATLGTCRSDVGVIGSLTITR